MECIISHRSALEFWRREPAEVARASNKLRIGALSTKPWDATELHGGNPWGLTTPLHILVGGSNARKDAAALRCHVSSGRYSRGSFVRGDRGLIVSSPELCFIQMASELSLVDLVVLGFEFCGRYRLDKKAAPEIGFRKDQPLTSTAKLRSYVERASGLKGLKNAQKALRFIADGSESPMETVLALLLTLPYRLGGYGFPMPLLNPTIDIEIAGRKTPRKQHYRFDLYWPSEQVDVEYDSDAFHALPEKLTKDSNRRNTLVSAGISVITVSRGQIMNIAGTHKVAKELGKTLRRRLKCPMPEFNAHRLALRNQLLPRSRML